MAGGKWRLTLSNGGRNERQASDANGEAFAAVPFDLYKRPWFAGFVIWFVTNYAAFTMLRVSND